MTFLEALIFVRCRLLTQTPSLLSSPQHPHNTPSPPLSTLAAPLSPIHASRTTSRFRNSKVGHSKSSPFGKHDIDRRKRRSTDSTPRPAAPALGPVDFNFLFPRRVPGAVQSPQGHAARKFVLCPAVFVQPLPPSSWRQAQPQACLCAECPSDGAFTTVARCVP